MALSRDHRCTAGVLAASAVLFAACSAHGPHAGRQPVAVAVAQAASPEALAAAENPTLTDPPIEVLLLGTFHLAQVDTLQYDVLREPRADEAARVVQALVDWRPDKVFVEWQPEFNQGLADSLYAALRRGETVRRRNEVVRLGMATAARLGHPRVYAVDHPGRYGVLYDAMARYARENAQVGIIEGMVPYTRRALYEGARHDSLRQALTLPAWLRLMNAPAYLAADHATYVERFARVGTVRTDLRDTADQANVGAALVADWYRRNTMIYGKMLKWLDWKERRIVLIIGASHVPTLRQLFGGHRGFRLVEVRDVLPAR